MPPTPAAERSWQAAPPLTRSALTAYAEGVNAYATRHPLPPEYQALELTSAAPWTPVDSVVIGKLLGFDGAALFFADLPPFAPFSPAATIPDATGASAATQPGGAPSAAAQTGGAAQTTAAQTRAAQATTSSRSKWADWAPSRAAHLP